MIFIRIKTFLDTNEFDRRIAFLSQADTVLDGNPTVIRTIRGNQIEKKQFGSNYCISNKNPIRKPTDKIR